MNSKYIIIHVSCEFVCYFKINIRLINKDIRFANKKTLYALVRGALPSRFTIKVERSVVVIPITDHNSMAGLLNRRQLHS